MQWIQVSLAVTIRLQGIAPASGALAGALASHLGDYQNGSPISHFETGLASQRRRLLVTCEACALPQLYCIVTA